jgi:tritrans,polycis-undecaprenyl-diphosphate synthase [geranylgeranyl-diphosphate specific]
MEMNLKAYFLTHIPNIMLKPVYRIYEDRLIEQIRSGNIPSHIGVIMDGNRRFASEFGLKTSEGHERGAGKLEDILDWCYELKIRMVTLYAFSTENFSRPKEEVDLIMHLFRKKFEDFQNDERVHKYRIKVKALGKLEMLPHDVREAIAKAEEATSNYDDYNLNICVAYGGRMEIAEAFRKVARRIESGEMRADDINIDSIKTNLYRVVDDPDLIIRTGGEVRLSNFLLFQAAYSELFFTDIYFPAFRKIDFLRIIREFQKRKRRFGK